MENRNEGIIEILEGMEYHVNEIHRIEKERREYRKTMDKFWKELRENRQKQLDN